MFPTSEGDAPDLLCQGVSHAERLVLALAVFSLVAVVGAWRWRDAAAGAGHRTLWALVGLLAGLLQFFLGLFLVPPGCLTTHTLMVLSGASLGWLLTGAVFLTGVAPVTRLELPEPEERWNTRLPRATPPEGTAPGVSWPGGRPGVTPPEGMPPWDGGA
jgi:hypothetical protein